MQIICPSIFPAKESPWCGLSIGPDRHRGVQFGALEEVCSVMFLYVAKGKELCCVVCSVEFV